MKTSSIFATSCLGLALCAANPAMAQSPEIEAQLPPPNAGYPDYGQARNPWQIYGVLFDFQWEEDFNGEDFVDESGSLFGLGIRTRWGLSEAWSLDLRFELYGGTVDYDGGVQFLNSDGSVTTSPLEDETDYVGTHFELTGVYEIASSESGSRIAALIGFGIHGWSRELGTGTRFGYTEDWTFLYLPIGLEASGPLTETVNWFASAKFDVPLDTEESAPGDTLEPDANGGVRVEAGIEFDRITASLFLHEYSFDESPVNSAGFLQPDSDATTFGLRLGYNF